MPVPHGTQYAEFFSGAISSGVLKKVPVMRHDKMVIVVACGHAKHGVDRFPHLWEHISPNTQIYGFNGGGVVADPEYAALGPDEDLFHRACIKQITGFIRLAVGDGTLEKGAIVPLYLVNDVPCKEISRLGWTPRQFVESSIRAKTFFKEGILRPSEELEKFHETRVEFKVGLLYYLGPPVHDSAKTWYAPRCDVQSYLDGYREDPNISASSEPVPAV